MSDNISILSRIKLTPAMLTSSTVAEPDTGEIAWDPLANYALGTVVYRAGTHHLYENLIAGVESLNPATQVIRKKIGSIIRTRELGCAIECSPCNSLPYPVIVRVNRILKCGIGATTFTIGPAIICSLGGEIDFFPIRRANIVNVYSPRYRINAECERVA